MMKMMVVMIMMLLSLISNINCYHINNRFVRSIRSTALYSVSLASKWIDEIGKKDINVNVVSSGDKLVCKAITNIKKGDAVFSLPMGLALDASKAAAKFSSIIKPSQLRTGDIGMLALLLISEKLLGSASKYANYIQSLPQPKSTLVLGVLAWNDNLVNEFISSTTRNVESQNKAVEYDSEIVKKLTEMNPKLFPPSVYSTEEFKWAVAIVKSRYVIVEGKPVLLPGMDYLEFDPLSSAEPTVQSAGPWGGKVLVVFAERSYEKGEEIVMSYGLKGSAECLEDHGIVPSITLDDACCEFAVSIDGTEKYADEKVNILERTGYGSSLSIDLEADSSSEIDPALLQFLRLKFIEGKDSFILESCFSNTVWYQLSLPFSKANEIKVFEYILKMCEIYLNKINSASKANDDSIAKGNDISAAIARLRLQEKAALQGSIKKAQLELSMLNGIDTREYYQERRLRELDLLKPLDENEIVMDGERPNIDANDY